MIEPIMNVIIATRIMMIITIIVVMMQLTLTKRTEQQNTVVHVVVFVVLVAGFRGPSGAKKQNCILQHTSCWGFRITWNWVCSIIYFNNNGNQTLTMNTTRCFGGLTKTKQTTQDVWRWRSAEKPHKIHFTNSDTILYKLADSSARLFHFPCYIYFSPQNRVFLQKWKNAFYHSFFFAIKSKIGKFPNAGLKIGCQKNIVSLKFK